MDFIKRRTKTKSIIASVVTGLALITLIMLSTLLNITSATRTIMCLIYTTALLLVLCIWEGTLEINVFGDYKCQRKYLCADGIVSICMGVLLIVCSVLFGSLQAVTIIKGTVLSTADIRIFLTVFLFIMTTWKSIILALSIKEKRFNWWCELVITIFWLALTILCLVSMFVKDLTTIAWITVSFSWALIAINIVGVLLSYVIKAPNYLETEQAKHMLEDDNLKKVVKGKEVTASTNEARLKKLKELKDQDLISNEDYENAKQNILKDMF